MITCQEAFAQLHDYLDHELTEAEIADMEKHLDRCLQCCDKFTFERQLKALVKKKGTSEGLPANLKDKILYAIRTVDGPPEEQR
ncbi:MAG: mycothiol system anti-sigma-R factor [Armatimonadetes bacterium]|nr:mycothiol system anti-sigma-R factor [Armatimonadota bacterium]